MSSDSCMSAEVVLSSSREFGAPSLCRVEQAAYNAIAAQDFPGASRHLNLHPAGLTQAARRRCLTHHSWIAIVTSAIMRPRNRGMQWAPV